MTSPSHRQVGRGAALVAVLALALAATVTCGLPARTFSGASGGAPAGSYRLPRDRPDDGQRRRELPSPAAPAAPPRPAREIPPGRATVHVPILMYHYIRRYDVSWDRIGLRLSIPPDEFARQLDWLTANDYHPIDLGQLRQYLLGHATLPSRPVVLTFDDGYADFYTTAFPMLRAHGFTAVSYVVSGFVGRPGYMTSDQVREVDAAGIEIGAHTVSHADLTRQAPGQLQQEVLGSKTALEGLLGHPVLDFCYPSGRFNAAVVAAVQAAGFQSATTTAPGTAHSAGDRFTWSRVRVQGGAPFSDFVQGMGAEEPSVAAPSPSPPPAPLEVNVPGP